MIRNTILAVSMLLLAAPAAAQLSQTEYDARYDRALAGGYGALFLCGAIGNAEHAGAERTAESVIAWELTGIQESLEQIVRELPYFIERGDDGVVDYVLVEWAADARPRIAVREEGGGCSLLPVWADVPNEPDSISGPQAREEGASNLVHYDPALHGDFLSGQAFADVYSAAVAGGYGAQSRTTAVLVSRNGVILAEFYTSGFGADIPQRTWSVAKSIAATLVGAAVHRGEADVWGSAGLGTATADPRRSITIDSGLRMATGRYSDTPGNRTDPLYFGGATVDERAIDWPLLHAPGQVFRYANNDTLAAVQAIEDTFEEHPPAALFDRLGMHHTVAETDWQGNYILSSQVWSTARDLARLGQLHLDDGVLPDGTRILPEGWVEYISSPSGPQPNGEWGYGAGWWVMSGFEGIPDDAFAARGNRGQYVVVIRSLDMVIVRRGEDPAGGSGFDIAAFTRDVIAASEE